jgi:beta-carotene 3-hydroxylase
MNIWIVLVVAALMEPITTFAHRAIMHGFGWGWHKSHHDRYGSRFEKNDYYPIVFSALAILLFAIGTSSEFLFSLAAGITLYGFCYAVVHEVIIHSRFGKIKHSNALFRYWIFGHNVHHQFQKAPYGFLVPITPKDLAQQAREHPRDLVTRYNKEKAK